MMKSKMIQIVLPLFFFVGSAFAQNNSIFTGGNGDGFGVSSAQQSLNNTIFSGGNGDGFDIATSAPQSLNNPIFAGGNGDGFDIASFLQSLNNPIFAGAGGGGDGFDEISIIVDPAVLPIELLYFDGFREGTTNFLNWATAIELNNDYFVLERSLNGIDFEQVIKVNGAGTTDIQQSYAHEDPIFPFQENAVVYYRLLQVDFDGTEFYSEIVAIDLPNRRDDQVFHVFPNPTSSSVTIRATQTIKAGETELILFDKYGRIIIQETKSKDLFSTGYHLDLNHVAPGQYLLLIKAGNRLKRQPIVKIGM